MPISTLALLVSAATYQRTRARDQHAEAVKVAVRQTSSPMCCGHDASSSTVQVENGTDRPLRGVCLVTADHTALLYNVLQPGITDHEHFPGPIDAHHAAVVWRDHDGRWWARHLSNQGLYRGGRIPGIGRMRAVTQAKRAALPPSS
ncbi:hypothetical protein ABT072_48195 [Streptomyces sp. NPDC002589]|uniref:hypothetical protein n=1 Tax=Streptomyces sp. NPDC002589 TaxID=3154420 RepID=UPI0033233793